MKSLCAGLVAGLALWAGSGKREALVKEAKITLAEALEKARAEVKEGTPVSCELTSRKGVVQYAAVFARGSAGLSVALDPKTGAVLGKAEVAKDFSKAAAAAKISLAKGIEIATKRVPGQATDVELEFEDGRAVLEVEVFADGKVFEVEIDAQTGQVLEVEEEDDDEGEGDDD
ncbi:MAG TPA: PepSY domain-containing protein [Planctomycetota bacterium]|nr:PepSY domain-containing protein [Planctomycetota bacterium]